MEADHPNTGSIFHADPHRVRIRTKQGEVEATALLAREQNPPKGTKPVVWKLLTNREAVRFEDAAELIDWYRARWEIEMFFNVLKQGCTQVRQLNR